MNFLPAHPISKFKIRVIKAGFYLKMSGKSDFLFSLELASSTIGLHTGKSCFCGIFKILIRTSRLLTRSV